MNNNITLNASMRSNLLSLRNISKQMDKTQLILATGKKVNSAIDNASAYYQARSLSNRAADLTALLDAMGQGIQTIEAATQGLTSGAEFLEQASAVVSEAASNVKYDFSDYTRVSTVEELKAAIADSNIDKIVVTQSLTFADNETITLTAGKTLAGLSKDITLSFTHTNTSTSGAINTQQGVTVKNLTINLSQKSSSVSCKGLLVNGNTWIENLNINTEGQAAHGIAVNNGNISGDCNISTNGTSASGLCIFTGTASAKLDCNIVMYGQFGEGIFVTRSGIVEGNYNIKTNNAAINCTLGGIISGNYNIMAEGTRAIRLGTDCIIKGNSKFNINAANLAIQNDDGAIFEAGAEFYMNNYSATEMQHFILDKTVVKGYDNSGDYGQFMTKKEDSKISADFSNTLEEKLEEAFKIEKNNYSEQYKKILEEYDNLLTDSSYQGVNLLKGGNLEVTFNESRSNQYTVAGVLADSMSLGLETRELSDMSAIKKSLEEITKAVNSIRSFQEELGNHYSVIKTRIDFTEALTDVLETGADNLTLADMNEASAQYLTLQTRQQLAINSLSLASQSARSVLSLF